MNVGFLLHDSIYSMIQKGWDIEQIRDFCCPRESDNFFFVTTIEKERTFQNRFGINVKCIGKDFSEIKDLDVFISCVFLPFATIKRECPKTKIYLMQVNASVNRRLDYSGTDGILYIMDHLRDMLLPIGVPIIRVYKSPIQRSVIDTEFEKRKTDSTMRCMVVSKPNKVKNYPLIIRAIKLVAEKLPVHLDIYGITKDSGYSESDEVKKIYREIGDCDFISVKSAMRQKDIIKEYREHDCVIQASTSEGLCFSALEALMTGTPLLCSRIRPFMDYVQEGRNALFFDLNVESLCNCLEHFYPLREQMAAESEGLRKLYHEYTVEFARQKWKLFYDAIEEKLK